MVSHTFRSTGTYDMPINAVDDTGDPGCGYTEIIATSWAVSQSTRTRIS
jgi:hypothetical protein